MVQKLLCCRMVHKLIADWATADPRIRRVWVSGADMVALELEPVPDSEETFVVWMAHCRRWHGELERRLGRRVRLAWIDPDVAPSQHVDELVYDSAGLAH